MPRIDAQYTATAVTTTISVRSLNWNRGNLDPHDTRPILQDPPRLAHRGLEVGGWILGVRQRLMKLGASSFRV